KSNLDSVDVGSAWLLDILLKAALAFSVFLSGPFIGVYYQNQDIGLAIQILSPVLILKSLMNPGLHVLRRELDYNILFKITLIQKLVSFSVVVIAAYMTRSFWAMIVGDIVSVITGLLLSYALCKKRYRLNSSRIKEQWIFSKW